MGGYVAHDAVASATRSPLSLKRPSMLTWTEKGERLDGEMHSINLFSDAYTRQVGVITFFRTVFPAKQEENHAEDGKEAFPPRNRLRNNEKLTLISSFFKTDLFFLLVFVTHMFHQEAFSLCKYH